ncbi:MAG: response regulator [Myxococcaceae bacterium]
MIRVVVADDHEVVRAGVRAVLASEPDVQVVGEAMDAASAMERLASLAPDVLLLDLGLPGDGVTVLRAAQERWPGTRVLVLSMHADGSHVRAALDAGATGYVVKGAGVEALVSALRAVASGGRFLDEGAARALQEPPAEPDLTWERLTPRERLVLRRVAEGRTNRQIAAELALSHKTVDSHRANLMRKLGVRDAQGVTRFAMRHGLLPED